ncbi:family 20 glycosylhydrolase, partial [Aerococcaceae bacterium NML191219]|nr:family 20 glycosylhydrolase [Aerococcaceae bacterium NML191219]
PGRPGVRTIVKEVTKENDVVVSERVISNTITTQPTPQIVDEGTKVVSVERYIYVKKIVSSDAPIPIEYIKDSSLPYGTSNVVQTGNTTIYEVTYKVKLVDNKEVERTEHNRIIKQKERPTIIREGTMQPNQAGVNLDIARRYYSVNFIKKTIDLLAENKGTFIQLHASDDQNYGIESDILGQTKRSATYDNKLDIYTNPNTGNAFLSKEQLQSIHDYARTKGIELIIEIDAPGHTRGISKLIEHQAKVNPNMRKQLRLFTENELNFKESAAVDLMKNIYSEVKSYLPTLSYMHVGGDEFGGDANYLRDYASYLNNIVSHLESLNVTARVWNDALIRENIDLINKKVQVAYWRYTSYDGSPDDRNLVPAPDLIRKGFKVLNYNGYYLYFVPSLRTMEKESTDYMIQDMKRAWDMGKWNLQHGNTLPTGVNMIGAAISIWGEDSKGIKEQDIFIVLNEYVKSFLKKVNP